MSQVTPASFETNPPPSQKKEVPACLHLPLILFLKVFKVAYDRLVTRQFKVEKNFDKFCRETKSALKYFTDQIEDQSD